MQSYRFGGRKVFTECFTSSPIPQYLCSNSCVSWLEFLIKNLPQESGHSGKLQEVLQALTVQGEKKENKLIYGNQN